MMEGKTMMSDRFEEQFFHDYQNDLPCCYCPECGGEIYQSDMVCQWDLEGPYICEECFKEKIKSLEPCYIAMAMRLNYGTAEEIFGR